LIVSQISSLEVFPQGQREDMASLRIQTAANGVNVFVESMRLLAGPLDIKIRLGQYPNQSPLA